MSLNFVKLKSFLLMWGYEYIHIVHSNRCLIHCSSANRILVKVVFFGDCCVSSSASVLDEY